MSGSISAKQILVLFNAKLRPVDIYDIPGIITSCFFLSPKALIDKIKASVPVAQPTEYFTLANLENFFSNFSTFFPSIKSPFLTVDKRDLLIFDCSFLENGLTSVNFIIKFSLNILLDYLRRYLFF